MKIVALLTAFLLTAADGLAQPPLARLTPEEFIKRFDKNGDGTLTREELPPNFAAAFDRFDTNKDGKLDRKEVAALLQTLRRRQGQNPESIVKRLLERMDTNKDGKISRAEAQGQVAANFDRLDTNKDGFLDRQELLTLARRMAAGPGGGKRPRAGTGPARAAVDFDSLDKNADGRLTRAELRGTPYADKFDEMDTNKDGKIDPREFAAYLKKQGERGQ